MRKGGCPFVEAAQLAHGVDFCARPAMPDSQARKQTIKASFPGFQLISVRLCFETCSTIRQPRVALKSKDVSERTIPPTLKECARLDSAPPVCSWTTRTARYWRWIRKRNGLPAAR